MNPFLYSSYVLLYSHAWYLIPLALVSLVRVILGRGYSRIPAFLSLMLCAYLAWHILWPQISPPGHPRYVLGTELHASAQRGWALGLPTALFLLSGLVPGARWRAMDVVILALAALTAISASIALELKRERFGGPAPAIIEAPEPRPGAV